MTSFALPPPDVDGITLDPGLPPLLGSDSNQAFIDGVVQLIEYSDLLGGEAGAEMIDIGPGAKGNAALGQTLGTGRAENPVTGEPYEPNEVPHGRLRASNRRVLGGWPRFRNPFPGIWNTIAY